jgi:hypothetical protein
MPGMCSVICAHPTAPNEASGWASCVASPAGGRRESFVSNTRLHYVGNRGSAVVDVLGTATLSILCGHWRYAHINSVRGARDAWVTVP